MARWLCLTIIRFVICGSLSQSRYDIQSAAIGEQLSRSFNPDDEFGPNPRDHLSEAEDASSSDFETALLPAERHLAAPGGRTTTWKDGSNGDLLRGHHDYSLLIATGLASSIGDQIYSGMTSWTTTSLWKALLACGLSGLIGVIATVVIGNHRRQFQAGMPEERSRKDPLRRLAYFVGDHSLETLSILAVTGILVILWCSGYLDEAFQTVMVNGVLMLLMVTIASCCLRQRFTEIRQQLHDIEGKLGRTEQAFAPQVPVTASGNMGAAKV